MASILINYADRRYYQAQQLNSKTGLEAGGFDQAVPYGRKNLDPLFLGRNREVLSLDRGAGYWLWKPYIVLASLRNLMTDEDILFYSDAGCHFINSAAPVLAQCPKGEKAILLFTLQAHRTNGRWTKRDCFHYMGLDNPDFVDLPQIMSTYIVCRKTPYTIGFFEEWQRYVLDPRIVTDVPNQCGLPNYPGFVEHRHDQSVLSLLGRKHDIATIPDISQWGNSDRPASLPQVVDHTRWVE